jgi:hypothetical protein
MKFGEKQSILAPRKHSLPKMLIELLEQVAEIHIHDKTDKIQHGQHCEHAQQVEHDDGSPESWFQAFVKLAVYGL